MICGIDPGRQCRIAYRCPVTGTVQLRWLETTDGGSRVGLYRDLLDLRVRAGLLIAYLERPEPGPPISKRSAILLMRSFERLATALEIAGLKVVEVDPRAWKAQVFNGAVAKGREGKRQAITLATLRTGIANLSSDEADATLLLLYGEADAEADRQ